MRRSTVHTSVVLAVVLSAFGCSMFGPKPEWEKPPPRAHEAPVVRPGALTRSTLDNGLKLLVLEDHSLPLVTLGVAVRRAAGSEDPERAGLSSLLSEVMKRGAGDRDALGLARAVDELGATLSVEAGWDAMFVSTSGLSRDFDALSQILADVALRPALSSDEIARARREQLASIEQGKDSPRTLVGWHTSRAVFGAHRYGEPLTGTQESVSKLDAAAVRDFHANVFIPENAIVFASGDLDADVWRQRAQELFGHWLTKPLPEAAPKPALPAPPERRIVVVDRPDLVQAQIVVAHDGLRRADKRRIAADLLNNVLGGGSFSSRLMVSLRAETGLTYGVYSGFSLRRRTGPFAVSTFTRVPETRRVVDLVLADLADIRANPPTADELSASASYAVGQFGLGLESSSAVMSALVELEVYDLPDDSLDTYRSRVRAVTTEDAATIARELMHPERAAIVVVGPADALAPQLEDLGPTTVVQP